jgi:hypothetical protein
MFYTATLSLFAVGVSIIIIRVAYFNQQDM